MRRFPLVAVGATVFFCLASIVAGENDDSAVSIPGALLTIYSPADFALVEEQREIEVTAGANEREIGPFPATMDPTTLRLEFRPATGIQTRHWLWQGGIATGNDVLDAAVGQRVRVDVRAGGDFRSYVGVLLSRHGGLSIRDEQGVLHLIPSYEHLEVTLPRSVQGRVVWHGHAERSQRLQVKIGYEVRALTWNTDTVLTLEPGERANRGTLSLRSTVRIENRTGSAFPEARVVLVAGSVRREEGLGRPALRAKRGFVSEETALASVVETPVAVGELYSYPLREALHLPAGHTLSAPWSEATGVPYEQEYVYHGQASEWPPAHGVILEREVGTEAPRHAQILLRFRNAKEHRLGEPLPAGKVRVGTLDRGRWVFLGEGTIGHTPAGETITLPLGEAFDIVGERRQVDFALDTGQRRLEETVEIVLRNRKEKPVDVRVRETLYRSSQWEIVEASSRYEKVDARTVQFLLPIASGEEARLRYRVRYSW